MVRFTLPCCLALLVGPACGAALNDALRETLILQEAMQAAIQDAEPAIACVLVSRSDDYIKLGETPAPDGSGRLGGFTRADDDALRKLDMAGPAYVPEVYGSGVVIDENGLILTNEHVIRDATKIYVRLPGGKGSYADIHAADPRSDLAVLRLLDPPGKLKVIKLGDAGKVRKGQFVISLANPFAAGFRDGSPSASWGIISNLRRRPAGPVNELERVKPLQQHGILLQTDARLNLGCSGGALLDLKGELIGLTTALAALSGSDTAGGFALPIDAGFKRMIEVLKKGEEIEYGFLGVRLSGGGGNGQLGLMIGGVSPFTPAAAVNLREGDTILAVNGQPIADADDLFVALGTTLAGGEARLDIVRPGGRTAQVTAVLTKFHVPGKFIASRRPTPQRGLRVDHLSVVLQNLPAASYPRGVSHGVVVREVVNGSAAAEALLKVNDIITHVQGVAIHTPADFYKKMQGLTGPIELTLSNTHQVKLN